MELTGNKICFVASPISALDPEFRRRFLVSVEQISTAIETRYRDITVYSATREIDKLSPDKDVFEDPETAHEKNKERLKSSRWFVMVYPNEQLKSGVIGELGLAEGIGIPCIMCVRDTKDLPWSFRNGTKNATIVLYDNEQKLVDCIAQGQLDPVFSGGLRSLSTLDLRV